MNCGEVLKMSQSVRPVVWKAFLSSVGTLIVVSRLPGYQHRRAHTADVAVTPCMSHTHTHTHNVSLLLYNSRRCPSWPHCPLVCESEGRWSHHATNRQSRAEITAISNNIYRSACQPVCSTFAGSVDRSAGGTESDIYALRLMRRCRSTDRISNVENSAKTGAVGLAEAHSPLVWMSLVQPVVEQSADQRCQRHYTG